MACRVPLTTTAVAVLVLVLLLSAAPTQSAYCTGGPSPTAPPNLFPVSVPSLSHVADWRNGSTGGGGRLFQAHHPAGNATFPVLHLFGSPYEMGFAHGTLLRNASVDMLDQLWAFLVEGTGSEAAVEALLLPIQKHSAPFVLARTTDEMRGLADATGYNYTRLLWMSLYPESSAGHCSMLGAWGSATRDSYGGKTLQMRALDYLTGDFLSDHHAVFVYHPRPGEGHVRGVAHVGRRGGRGGHMFFWGGGEERRGAGAQGDARARSRTALHLLASASLAANAAEPTRCPS
jgi:isopenicillin-N N-acyltransferase-like protein